MCRGRTVSLNIDSLPLSAWFCFCLCVRSLVLHMHGSGTFVEWVNEWTNERMNEWTKERTDFLTATLPRLNNSFFEDSAEKHSCDLTSILLGLQSWCVFCEWSETLNERPSIRWITDGVAFLLGCKDRGGKVFIYPSLSPFLPLPSIFRFHFLPLISNIYIATSLSLRLIH